MQGSTPSLLDAVSIFRDKLQQTFPCHRMLDCLENRICRTFCIRMVFVGSLPDEFPRFRNALKIKELE